MDFAAIYLTVVRFILPVLAVLFVWALVHTLFSEPVFFKNKKKKSKKKGGISQKSWPGFCILLLILFQLLCTIQMILAVREDYLLSTLICFSSLIVITVICVLLSAHFRKIPAGLEMMAFFLTTLGFCVAASAEPSSLYKLLAALALGVVCFYILLALLQKKEFVVKSRYVILGMALLLLFLTVFLGEVRHGAQNWIDLKWFTIQPSELVKALFILASAGIAYRERTRVSAIVMSIFCVICMGVFAYSADFGSALIYFVTYFILLFLTCRSRVFIGSVMGLSLVGGGAATQVEYVKKRFSIWGKAFELANNEGYQQSRTLIAIASGGLLGLGGGKGFLRTVVASDTDLVFGILCEEWGLIVALCVIVCLVLLFMYALQNTKQGADPFYCLISLGAAGLLLFQTALNLFGSTDVLPLTGVTLAFVSNGGTSMVACWILLALIVLPVSERRKSA